MSRTELNNLNSASGTITREQEACGEWADQWPNMHAVTKRNTIGVMAELERRACPLDNQGNDSERV